MSRKRPAKPSPSSAGARLGMLWLAIFGATLLAYWPSLTGGFIWNDSEYVTARDLRSLEGLGRIWSEVGATEQYYPLLHSAFWIEQQIWGDSPIGYHLANVLLHALAAGLFAVVLRQLQVPGAWLAALLFALHPICVESVAWISEQKNTLSLVLYLAAAATYLRFDAERDPQSAPGGRRYYLALVLFAGALLTKTTTAVLPPVLLVIAWWRRGRIEWQRDVRPLVPWFALAIGMGLFSAWVERHFVGADGRDFALSFLQRGLLAGRIICFYLGKLLLPVQLIFIYPRWAVDPSAVAQWLFPIGVLAGLATGWYWRMRSRTPLAVLLLFTGCLFPVLGFFNVYAFMFSFVADHWQYLPCLAVLALAGSLLSRLPRPVYALLLGTLAVLTWQQSRMYTDMETFYRVTLAKNPDCWMAHNNLGGLLRQAGRNDEAEVEYNETLRLRPDSAKAHTNLGNILRERRQLAHALPHFQAAIELEPNNADHQDNLAGALRDAGRPREALIHHREALRYDPHYHAIHNNYGMTLRQLGRLAEAIGQFEEAARLEPKSVPAHLNLALSYELVGREADSRAHYLEARRLSPTIPEIDLGERGKP